MPARQSLFWAHVAQRLERALLVIQLGFDVFAAPMLRMASAPLAGRHSCSVWRQRVQQGGGVNACDDRVIDLQQQRRL